jgi:hypothetical protein
MKVYEKVDGALVPVISNGVHVTIGMVPPEFRWIVDTSGVVFPREQYKARDLRYYEDYYELQAQLSGQRSMIDDPEARYIPPPTKRLKQTVNSDENGYVDIGYDPLKPAPPKLSIARDNTDDPIVDPEELWQRGFQQVRVDEDDEASRLRAENDRLREQLAAASAPKPKPERPTITAPCGKELKGAVHFHKKKCQKCQELEA